MSKHDDLAAPAVAHLALAATARHLTPREGVTPHLGEGVRLPAHFIVTPRHGLPHHLVLRRPTRPLVDVAARVPVPAASAHLARVQRRLERLQARPIEEVLGGHLTPPIAHLLAVVIVDARVAHKLPLQNLPTGLPVPRLQPLRRRLTTHRASKVYRLARPKVDQLRRVIQHGAGSAWLAIEVVLRVRGALSLFFGGNLAVELVTAQGLAQGGVLLL